MSKFIVTGGAGFIGSHLTDRLISLGHSVTVLDNLSSGFREQVNPSATFIQTDILYLDRLTKLVSGADGIFHLAAIARTPWCISDPTLCSITNVQGTVNVLEAARLSGVKRTVVSSSNVVYAAYTPYRVSKECDELWVRAYAETYGLSALCLRYSNVYGTRQSESGPSPNVFAAFRKSHRENGHINVTGDGEQSRDFTHVSDINRGQILAMESEYVGEPIDLCTGRNWTMNQVVKLFGSTPKYIAERHGDVKHIIQSPARAKEILGWSAEVTLVDGIKDVLDAHQ